MLAASYAADIGGAVTARAGALDAALALPEEADRRAELDLLFVSVEREVGAALDATNAPPPPRPRRASSASSSASMAGSDLGEDRVMQRHAVFDALVDDVLAARQDAEAAAARAGASLTGRVGALAPVAPPSAAELVAAAVAGMAAQQGQVSAMLRASNAGPTARARMAAEGAAAAADAEVARARDEARLCTAEADALKVAVADRIFADLVAQTAVDVARSLR